MESKKKKSSKLVIFLLVTSLLLSSCSLFYYEKDIIIYRIRSGDSLFKVSKKFNVSYKEIADDNNIIIPSKIFVGQIIEVPYYGQKPKNYSVKEELEFASEPKKVDKKAAKSSTIVGKKISLSNVQTYVDRLYWPISKKTRRLTSKFGWRWTKFHEGIDLAAPSGTPIYAAHSGKVVYSGNKLRGYGNIVIIKGNDLLTVYSHNRKNRVRAGRSVKRGQHIADVGTTGKVTGPHVHFETRVKNKSGKYQAVDPLVLLP